jgi:cell division GTPase FtsZ
MSLDLPELPLETESSSSVGEIPDESGGCRIYGILGSGQAGGRLAESFHRRGYRKALAVNTAPQDLEPLSLPEDQKVLLPSDKAGAGKDMRAGEEAAGAGAQAVYDAMLRTFGRVDHIMICAGAGGGSGGGSVLVLHDLAVRYMAYLGHPEPQRRVGAILTLPKNGECASPAVAENARVVAKFLGDLAERGDLSPLVLVDNGKIEKMFPRLTVHQFWPHVNDTVTGLFHVFNVIPSRPSAYVTFDPADYESVMVAGGCMTMGVTAVRDWRAPACFSSALNTNVDRSLLAEGFDLRGATHAAALVVGGSQAFGTAEGLMTAIESGFDALASTTGDAIVHRGVYEDDARDDRINVYTLIGGLKAPTKRLASLERSHSRPSTPTGPVMPPPRFNHRIYDE